MSSLHSNASLTAQERTGLEAPLQRLESWHRYGADDGVYPFVMAMTEDAEGYLWVGGYGGLSRFNGHSFEKVLEPRPEVIQCLAVDSAPGVWGGAEGAGIFHWSDGDVQFFDFEEGGHNLVRQLYVDRSGILWAGTKGGLLRRRGNGFIPDEDFGQADVQAIFEDSQGGLWIGTWGDGVYMRKDANLLHLDDRDGLPGNIVRAVVEDLDNRVWFGTMGGGLAVLDETGVHRIEGQDELLGRDVERLLVDVSGRLWISTIKSYLAFYEKGSFQSTQISRRQVHRDQPHAIFEDSSGQVWCAMEAAWRLARDPFVMLLDEPIVSVSRCRHDGFLLVATEAAFWLVNSQTGSRKRLRALLPSEATEAIEFDNTGAIWKTDLNLGLWKYDNTQALAENRGLRLGPNEGFTSRMPSDVFVSADGAVSVVGQEPAALYRCVGGVLSQQPLGDGGLIDFRCVYHDRSGRMWLFGGHSGGLWVIEKEKVKQVCSQRFKVFDVTEDEEGEIWAACFHGACLLKEDELELLPGTQGFFSRAEIDTRGTIWLATPSSGVYRCRGRHLQRLTSQSGLPSNLVTSLLPSADGSMIIGTRRGLVRWRGDENRRPGIEIKRVIADKDYGPARHAEITADRLDSLRVEFSGISLSSPSLTYSYRLLGREYQWQDTPDRHATYYRLQPGTYTFEVVALNESFVQSKTPARVDVRVIPERPSTLKRTDKRIAEEALRLIHRAQGQTSVQQVASELYVSTRLLRRCFQNHSEKSAQQWILELRLEKAKRLLEASQFSISEISERCGYSSSEYFSRQFKKNVGICPREYRGRSSLAEQ